MFARSRSALPESKPVLSVEQLWDARVSHATGERAGSGSFLPGVVGAGVFEERTCGLHSGE